MVDPKGVRQPLHMFKQRNDWPVIPFLRRSHPGLREGTEEVGRPVLRDGGGPAENGLRGLGQAPPVWTKVTEGLAAHKENTFFHRFPLPTKGFI